MQNDDHDRPSIDRSDNLSSEEADTKPAPSEMPGSEPPTPGGSMSENSTTAMPGTFELINRGIKQLEEKLNPLLVSLVVGVVALIPFVLAAWMLEGSSPVTASPLLWAFMALAFVWLLVISIFNNGAVIYLLSHQSEPLSYRDCFAWAVRNFWRIAWIGVLTTLMMVTATAALIIPALILSVYLLFSTIALAKEERTGLRAIVRSTDIVYGAFWQILGRMILLFLLAIVAMWLIGLVFGMLAVVLGGTGEVLGNLLGSLIQIAVGWLLIAILVQLFEFRSRQKPMFQYEEYRNLSLLYKVMAWLGLVIPVLAGGALLSFAVTLMSEMSPGQLGGPDGDVQFEAFIEQLEEMEASGEFENSESMDMEEFRRLQEEMEAAMPQE